MKTTFKFIIAVMAASAVFASCQKELATGNPTESTDGIRVISASFSAPTKSTLDNKTPKFEGGETIKVSNNTSSENCTISVTGEVATFSTTLTGTLTAVYPSTAAKMNGNVIDETGVLVSTEQDGTFASANIAMATGITTSATFTNKTAVIKITPGAGANTKYVEVITAGPEIANDVPEGSTFTKLNKIHVNTTSAEPVYVSILVPSGLKVQNLSFADGHNIKTAKDNTDAIAINTISTVTATGWDKPYVEINGLKWATMNIGATSLTDAGKYFMWGYTDGHSVNTTGTTTSGSTIKNAFSDQTFKEGERGDDSKGFAWDNYIKFTSSKYSSSSKNVFTKYVPQTMAPTYGEGGFYDNETTLDLADDAANANWGGSWRMPTKDELNALGAGEWVSSPGNGREFGTSSNTIFLPAAGYGEGTSLSGVDNYSYYWSSSLNTATPYRAFSLNVGETYPGIGTGTSRYSGQYVRALSD